MRMTRTKLSVLIALVLATGCREHADVPPEGIMRLSLLETMQDYFLPLAIENDIAEYHTVVLNRDTIDFGIGDYIVLTENGFHELMLMTEDQGSDTILFTTTTEERAASEWGVCAWTPQPFTPVYLGWQDIDMIFPARYTGNISVPFIFFIREGGIIKPVYCTGTCQASDDTFKIKRGIGSVSVVASSLAQQVDFKIGGKKATAGPVLISEPVTELEGVITEPLVIPANGVVRLTGSLTVTSTATLTIEEGALIMIDEGADIKAGGPVRISGTADNPVLFTSSGSDVYWGGFITNTAAGTVEAAFTIFCRSGYHDSGEYSYGHAGRQALFYTENSTLTLENCFMIDNIGQIFYPVSSTLTLNNIIVQRAKTGGQMNYSDLTMNNCFFTDFPDDSRLFADNDNDALYLIGTNADIENTVFMYAKDDGLDSGGEDGDAISLTNCRFEACFHEGAALSSGDGVTRRHEFINCVFTNCGQGLELGFSSPNHYVTADGCLFENNGVGIRFGDNYGWSHIDGTMLVRNSRSVNNGKDVWNMVRRNWAPDIDNMIFENTFVSRFCPQYPLLETEN